jgi:F420H(2)-dependent quinone reductase
VRMTVDGEYEPSPARWVRDQVAEYEASGGGSIRKMPLMRVEHDGDYALVASKGGAPAHPVWYYNLVADPESVLIQDGPEPFPVAVRELAGDERAQWWERAVAAYPPYAEYQDKTERTIPVFLATRKPR